jgi:cytidyltransferase-like protein
MRIVVVSGYFNPLHTGHLDYLEAARKLGNRLIVIVNNDHQVQGKGSVPFMKFRDRLRIGAALSCVDTAVESVDVDPSVVQTLKRLYESHSVDYFFESMTFANGGDRHAGNSPEEQYCNGVGIHLSYDVGGGKTNSSSTIISSATQANKIRNV